MRYHPTPPLPRSIRPVLCLIEKSEHGGNAVDIETHLVFGNALTLVHRGCKVVRIMFDLRTMLQLRLIFRKIRL